MNWQRQTGSSQGVQLLITMSTRWQRWYKNTVSCHSRCNLYDWLSMRRRRRYGRTSWRPRATVNAVVCGVFVCTRTRRSRWHFTTYSGLIWHSDKTRYPLYQWWANSNRDWNLNRDLNTFWEWFDSLKFRFSNQSWLGFNSLFFAIRFGP